MLIHNLFEPIKILDPQDHAVGSSSVGGLIDSKGQSMKYNTFV